MKKRKKSSNPPQRKDQNQNQSQNQLQRKQQKQRKHLSAIREVYGFNHCYFTSFDINLTFNYSLLFAEVAKSEEEYDEQPAKKPRGRPRKS